MRQERGVRGEYTVKRDGFDLGAVEARCRSSGGEGIWRQRCWSRGLGGEGVGRKNHDPILTSWY